MFRWQDVRFICERLHCGNIRSNNTTLSHSSGRGDSDVFYIRKEDIQRLGRVSGALHA